MRIVLASCLLFVLPVSAATLQVGVNRNGFAGPIQKIEAVSMAGASDASDLPWLDSRLLDAGSNRRTGIGPKLVEVAFDMPGTGCRRMPVEGMHRALPAIAVEQDRLDDRIACIQAEKIGHCITLSRRYPRLPRHRRDCG